MNEYTVEDISVVGYPTEIMANSPLEAAQKAYPEYEVKRDYTNKGKILVGSSYNTRYGERYRIYVYEITKKGD